MRIRLDVAMVKVGTMTLAFRVRDGGRRLFHAARGPVPPSQSGHRILLIIGCQRPLVLVVFPPSVPDLRPWGIVNILFEKTTATALGVSVKERWISAFDPRSSEFLSFCLSALCILAHTRLLPSPFSSCSIPGVDMES